MSKEVYIVDGIRTPIGNFCGTLSSIRTDDLAAHAIKALIDRHPNLDLESIEDLISLDVQIRQERTIEMLLEWQVYLRLPFLLVEKQLIDLCFRNGIYHKRQEQLKITEVMFIYQVVLST